jgi:hypothetical protein
MSIRFRRQRMRRLGLDTVGAFRWGSETRGGFYFVDPGSHPNQRMSVHFVRCSTSSGGLAVFIV